MSYYNKREHKEPQSYRRVSIPITSPNGVEGTMILMSDTKCQVQWLAPGSDNGNRCTYSIRRQSVA